MSMPNNPTVNPNYEQRNNVIIGIAASPFLFFGLVFLFAVGDNIEELAFVPYLAIIIIGWAAWVLYVSPPEPDSRFVFPGVDEYEDFEPILPQWAMYPDDVNHMIGNHRTSTHPDDSDYVYGYWEMTYGSEPSKDWYPKYEMTILFIDKKTKQPFEVIFSREIGEYNTPGGRDSYPTSMKASPSNTSTHNRIDKKFKWDYDNPNNTVQYFRNAFGTIAADRLKRLI